MTTEVNGWHLYYFELFEHQLIKLKEEVEALKRNDPKGYKSHARTKLLASIYKVISMTIPSNPGDKQFELGHTLGKNNIHWRRVKKGIPNRYRLFFRYSSSKKIIVYVWFNDETTLRKEDAKTDVYRVFARYLKKGIVPSSIDELIRNEEVITSPFSHHKNSM